MHFELKSDEPESGELRETNPLFANKSNSLEIKSINFDPVNTQINLESLLKTFTESSCQETPDNLKLRYNKLHKALSKYNRTLLDESGKALNISYLEHSHYIFSYFGSMCSEEDRVLIESRMRQFDKFSFPDESYYALIKKTIKFISILICKWRIFDIRNYNYRFKGRSLSLNLINMKNINSQSITLDILWFTYAIYHQPFVSKISKPLLSYAKIVHLQFNKLFSFILANDLGQNSFILPSFLQKLLKRPNTQLQELYSLLKSSELAYRYFEKNLIGEFLKLI
jgi:hypothetical protein